MPFDVNPMISISFDGQNEALTKDFEKVASKHGFKIDFKEYNEDSQISLLSFFK